MHCFNENAIFVSANKISEVTPKNKGLGNSSLTEIKVSINDDTGTSSTGLNKSTSTMGKISFLLFLSLQDTDTNTPSITITNLIRIFILFYF